MDEAEDTPFQLTESQEQGKREIAVRPNQAIFEFEVFRRYGEDARAERNFVAIEATWMAGAVVESATRTR